MRHSFAEMAGRLHVSPAAASTNPRARAIMEREFPETGRGAFFPQFEERKVRASQCERYGRPDALILPTGTRSLYKMSTREI